MKGFKKYFIPIEMGETDDDMLWNPSEEDGNVRSECEDDALQQFIYVQTSILFLESYSMHPVPLY